MADLPEIDALLARVPEGYTPGPWFADEGVCFTTIRCGANTFSGQAIADTLESQELFERYQAPSVNHEIANATLIALAPDLVTALRALRAEVERQSAAISDLTRERDEARDALCWYWDQFCEGFCVNVPTGHTDAAMELDCSGCRARAALSPTTKGGADAD